MSDYELLQQGLKNLDREEARQYYNSYIKYGTNQKHPIDAIFDLIEKSEKTSYKIKIIRKDTNTQYNKKVYETFDKFTKYGKDIVKRFHNINHYNNLETFVECYKMVNEKWLKIDIPEHFKIC
jgi:pyruvate/oxaloacetate carboxyltransferase